MRVCPLSLPACEIPTGAPLPRSYACSASRASKFKAQHPCPAPSFHMRYCSLPSPVIHVVARLARRNGAEKPWYHHPATKGWWVSTSSAFKESTHGSSSLALSLASLLWLYQSPDISEVSYTVKNQRPVQWSMLRTEGLKTGGLNGTW